MNGISPWALAATLAMKDKHNKPLFETAYNGYLYTIFLTMDSLWLQVQGKNGGNAMFRMAYSPAGGFKLVKIENLQFVVELQIKSEVGKFDIQVMFYEQTTPLVRYTTTLSPAANLFIPFWPRDIFVGHPQNHPGNADGQIHVRQVGTRSGLLYFSYRRPKAGSVLYLQNLTALASYCEQTKTSCKEVVGGTWPDLGFALPVATEKPLAAKKAVILSDAIVAFDAIVPETESGLARQYLNLLAAAYTVLPKPVTVYQDWPTVLKKGLQDLNSAGCWSQFSGEKYLNAYVCDYATPPEIMVQLAVLLPLTDYAEWSKNKLPEIEIIKKNLPLFYNDKLKTIMRWLPAAEDKLQGEEEQKKPKVMDSWYLHHPLLNLSRMALKGDKGAKKLLLDSLPYAIKVARHFKYNWPVFYHMETLEVIKAETAPGKGGEKDVAGMYAHVLLQAYQLMDDKKFLREAEKAARTLQGKGFELLYQANNTAFTAGALLRLFKITGKKIYLELSYLCLANLFQNVQLWDCNYGYGKHFPSFFALFPLKDAPYTAVYEEQETFCAMHDYLTHARSSEVLPAVILLISEYIRNVINRAAFYYPPMLPKEMLSDKVKMGEVDCKLWIAVEDLYDGWEKAGQVGQEVYGAGNAFGILPRHCFIVPGEKFRLFTDYPAFDFNKSKGNKIKLFIGGSESFCCRLVIMKECAKKLPAFTLLVNNKPIAGVQTKDDNLEYELPGNHGIILSWSA